jgi:hypothetical protein
MLLVAGAVALAGQTMPLASTGPAAGSRDVLVTATAGFVDMTAPPQALPAQGDLAVARSALGEQARAVVALDIPPEAAAATVTFRASGQPGSSYGTSSVMVCRVTTAWSPGPGQPLASAPAIDCGGAAPVTGAGPWTFDLSHVLRAWAGGAPVLGIALVDDLSTAPAEITFNIVGAEHVGTMTSSAPTTRLPTPAAAPAPPSMVADYPPYPGLTSGLALPPVAPAPTVAVLPVPTADTTTVLVPATAATATLPSPALPLSPAGWLLLPLGAGFLLVLRRAVSAAADEPVGLAAA